MSELRFEKIKLLAAELGNEKQFPDLSISNNKISYEMNEVADEKLFFGYGNVDNNLPYTIQEEYDRNKQMRDVQAVIIENNILKAIFLPEYGCRLWSLYHKVKKRELLYVNPVLQFGNLAIRNAWFSGGVEWNIGFRGHTPFTCDKVFCEKVIDTETNTPVLRFYEWERIRQAFYEVDAYLPQDSEHLMVRVRIKNCRNEEIPMYWWSNIAVNETIDTRVVVDAKKAYTHKYSGGISIINTPYHNNLDITYSALQKNSVDYFFRIEEDSMPYIAALDKEGKGLIHCSTKKLKSRKLFLWGMEAGGRKWQEFLSKPVTPYLEIQGGIARTQWECVPMAPYEEFEWLETYGLMEADGDLVHGEDWAKANTDVKKRLINEQYLEDELERTRKSIVGVQGELLQTGSKWASLENLRRKANNLDLLSDNLNFYDEMVLDKSDMWAGLLNDGSFPCPEFENVPAEFMTQSEWDNIFEANLERNKDNWFFLYNLAVFYYGNKRFKESKQYFLKSNQSNENPYALACLTHFAIMEDKTEEAYNYILKAYSFMPENYALTKLTLEALIKIKKYKDVISIYNNLKESLKEKGRLKYMYIVALVNDGKIEECGKMLKKPFEIPDLREGEVSLHDLWYKYCNKITDDNEIPPDMKREEYLLEKYPIPKWMNFNMKKIEVII